jgi:predicted RecB family nuclease
VADYMAYYRLAKARFEAVVLGTAGSPAATPVYPLAVVPDPVEHCEVCRWWADCSDRRRVTRHLSIVAGISSQQRRALVDRRPPIETIDALAALELPVRPRLDGVGDAALERVRNQARIQVVGEREGRLKHELLPVEAEKGLASLPQPSPNDLFFDIEGDPYAFDDGLDYLFGVLSPGETDAGREPEFKAIWSRDATGEINLEGEKRAFEEVIDLLIGRWEADPSLHVYHYAPYETTAVKRLMGRHGTREREVDRLLRGGVFVDLYRAVHQGLRASVESYSIKRLEPLYAFTREVDLRDAGSSIVAFEEWLQLGEEARRAPDADQLQRIERYNRDDVVSNRRLRDWLEEQRRVREREFGQPIPRPAPRQPEPPPTLNAYLEQVEALAARLTQGVPVDPADRTDEQQATWLLAQLLSWHRREDKATWWLYYHLMNDLTDEERIEADEPIAGLELVEQRPDAARSVVFRYRFPEQEHEVEEDDPVFDPATGMRWSVAAVDDAAQTVDLKRGRAKPISHPTSIVPLRYVENGVLREALLRIGEWVADHGIDSTLPDHRAARDLLLGRRPRLADAPPPSVVVQPVAAPGQMSWLEAGPGATAEASVHPAEVALREAEDPVDAARRLAGRLNGGVLAIQGPPGSGKTFTGGRVISQLVRDGYRVGITANSHKVISHLLNEACKAAEAEGTTLRAMQKPSSDNGAVCDHRFVELTGDNREVVSALAARAVNVVAGTVWLWSRPDMAEAVDVLFVDEAGQLSLANTIAAGQGARSLVLLGDPLQLDQPLQGTHPPGAERSALAHLLGDEAVMPSDRGLFLEHTWRLHPDLCRFTSDAFYESQLSSRPSLARQELRAMGPMDGTGLRLVQVIDRGNQNAAPREAEVVAQLARSLVEGGASWVNDKGEEARVTWRDVLIVAPYNAQVAEIGRHLPAEARDRVGTVDKFQGQQGAVAFYSMASSSPEDAPRGMSFLYSRHRLNVATSRARCLAVLVCSPELVRVRARTPAQMRLANALCQFVELAEVVIP